MTAVIQKTYRRNVKAACAALNRKVPKDFTTTIATNGDFIVYDSGTRIAGRLHPGTFEPFLKRSATK